MNIKISFRNCRLDTLRVNGIDLGQRDSSFSYYIIAGLLQPRSAY